MMWTGWSPSSRWILTICWDRQVRLWDATSERVIWQWKTKQQNWTGCFDPTKRGILNTLNGGDVYPNHETEEEPEYVIATCGNGTGDDQWRFPRMDDSRQ